MDNSVPLAPVNFFQILSVDVCVHLRCGNVRMSQHFLDSSQVRAALQEVRREGMSERVRVNLLLNSSRNAELMDNIPNRHST